MFTAYNSCWTPFINHYSSKNLIILVLYFSTQTSIWELFVVLNTSINYPSLCHINRQENISHSLIWNLDYGSQLGFRDAKVCAYNLITMLQECVKSRSCYFSGRMEFRTEKKEGYFYRNQGTSESNKCWVRRARQTSFGHLSGDVARKERRAQKDQCYWDRILRHYQVRFQVIVKRIVFTQNPGLGLFPCK